MRSLLATLSLAVLLVLVAQAPAADDAASLQTAQGVVDKVEKDSVTIKPRDDKGRFAKSITLKVTGTTQVSTLSVQTRSGKEVFVQRSGEAKDLQANQSVAIIYATGKDGSVLLSVVAQAAK